MSSTASTMAAVRRLTKPKAHSRTAGLAYGLLIPALVVVAALIAYPLYIVVSVSVRQGEGLDLAELATAPLTFEHYRTLFSHGRTLNALWVSAAYTVGATSLSFGIGLATALLLNQRFPGRRALRPILLLPWAVPGVVASVIFLWMLDASYGVINYLLTSAGLIDGYIAWLVNPDTALIGVIIPTAWKYYPFFTLVLLAALQTVPKELYEAARVDGAGALKQFRSVTWPAIRGAAVLALAIGGLGVFREFDFIYPLTGGGPNGATETLAIRIYDLAFRYFDLPQAAAVGIFTIAVAGIAVALMWRRMRADFF